MNSDRTWSIFSNFAFGYGKMASLGRRELRTQLLCFQMIVKGRSLKHFGRTHIIGHIVRGDRLRVLPIKLILKIWNTDMFNLWHHWKHCILNLREKLLNANTARINASLKTIALRFKKQSGVKTVECMLILSKSLLKSLRIMKHYPCII